MDTDIRKEADEERIGIFPSWRWLYGAVAVYTAAWIIVLYVLTVTLDLGAS